ncbi:unnamed protein product [Pleuronectes platessa]|uniref:Uncharacterized protein n=1 Tax=Pleuronectes platessa TaxID=8262 RepID=A0A9N7TZQ6_PLEPL|nr:unnamed protein product [Pleuronectes platessa]
MEVTGSASDPRSCRRNPAHWRISGSHTRREGEEFASSTHPVFSVPNKVKWVRIQASSQVLLSGPPLRSSSGRTQLWSFSRNVRTDQTSASGLLAAQQQDLPRDRRLPVPSAPPLLQKPSLRGLGCFTGAQRVNLTGIHFTSSSAAQQEQEEVRGLVCSLTLELEPCGKQVSVTCRILKLPLKRSFLGDDERRAGSFLCSWCQQRPSETFRAAAGRRTSVRGSSVCSGSSCKQHGGCAPVTSLSRQHHTESCSLHVPYQNV